MILRRLWIVLLIVLSVQFVLIMLVLVKPSLWDVDTGNVANVIEVIWR